MLQLKNAHRACPVHAAFVDKPVKFSNCASASENIREGPRVPRFECRVAIAVNVNKTGVTIFRLFYGGRDWEADEAPP